jgi:hypothetical protein
MRMGLSEMGVEIHCWRGGKALRRDDHGIPEMSSIRVHCDTLCPR